MRLATNGDRHERLYWGAFIADRFPSYEQFWLDNVVPLRGEGVITFRGRDDVGPGRDEDVAVAQLHYTTLRHIGRVHDLLHRVETVPFPLQGVPTPAPGSAVSGIDASSAVGYGGGSATYQGVPRATVNRHPVSLEFDTFTEAFVRLAAAIDVADELLERRSKPGLFRPWNEADGKKARIDWRNSCGDPLGAIRRYRNRLVHGRVVPALERAGDSWFPRLDRVNEYLDWRPVQNAQSWAEIASDFERADEIVRQEWSRVVDYFEENWRAHLLPRSSDSAPES